MVADHDGGDKGRRVCRRLEDVTRKDVVVLALVDGDWQRLTERWKTAHRATVAWIQGEVSTM